MGLSLTLFVRSLDPSETERAALSRAAGAAGVAFQSSGDDFVHAGDVYATLFLAGDDEDPEFGEYPVWGAARQDDDRLRLGFGLSVGQRLRAAGFEVVVEDDRYGVVPVDASLGDVVADDYEEALMRRISA